MTSLQVTDDQDASLQVTSAQDAESQEALPLATSVQLAASNTGALRPRASGTTKTG